MGIKRQLSFSSGELHPVLHDRVSLDKFTKGLATARNVIISKTGSIISRFSTAYFKDAKTSGNTVKCYSPSKLK